MTAKICRNCGHRIVPDDKAGWLHSVGAVGTRRACPTTIAEPVPEASA